MGSTAGRNYDKSRYDGGNGYDDESDLAMASTPIEAKGKDPNSKTGGGHDSASTDPNPGFKVINPRKEFGYVPPEVLGPPNTYPPPYSSPPSPRYYISENTPKARKSSTGSGWGQEAKGKIWEDIQPKTSQQLKSSGLETVVQPVDIDTKLLAAAADGDEATVRSLLDAGASIESRKDSKKALLKAAANRRELQQTRGYIAMSKRLPQYRDGRTALQAESGAGHDLVVKFLLEKGANVNAEPSNCECRTALQAAAGGGHKPVVELLLGASAKVNAGPSVFSGRTALQAAAEGGHESVVELLLGAGANVNAKPSSGSGRTALQAAAGGGHKPVVELLLGAGANVNAKPSFDSGRTALQAAAKRGHKSTMRLLQGVSNKALRYTEGVLWSFPSRQNLELDPAMADQRNNQETMEDPELQSLGRQDSGNGSRCSDLAPTIFSRYSPATTVKQNLTHPSQWGKQGQGGHGNRADEADEKLDGSEIEHSQPITDSEYTPRKMDKPGHVI